MSDEDNTSFEISRRKTLAALGTIGAASAGAGLGTTAWFSDRETFENNTISAGSLDLKVDWEEHYYDGSAAGAERANDPSEADFFLPGMLPNNDVAMGALSSRSIVRPIALNFTDGKDAFWDNTSIEAFPDADDDGIQNEPDGFEVCEDGADTPEDLDPTVDGALRTNNLDTVDEETGEYKPLIALDDVKPGDFGELTLSFHLCDNPGYVWLTGELLENAENGLTEPERKDPDEDGSDGEGELLDKILTRLWYDDDCDNQHDELAGDLDLMLAIDVSGSIQGTEQDQMRDGINAFINELPALDSVHVGSLTFGDGEITNFQELTTPGELTVELESFGGNTPMPGALDIADQVVTSTGRPEAQKAVVLFTDGGPNYQNVSYSANGYTAPRGGGTFTGADTASATVSVGEMDETADVADMVKGGGTRIATIFVGDDDTEAMTDPAITKYQTLPNFLATEIASDGYSFTADLGDLEELATDLVESVATEEEIFFTGTLGQALTRLEEGHGIPLDGDRNTGFDEITGQGDDPNREPFENSSTECIGMEWWLPINHGNEVQGDSVGFDLGFYAEQARHNDGSGLPLNETETNSS